MARSMHISEADVTNDGIPQFHLALEEKYDSSRLIQDGWYAFGQPLPETRQFGISWGKADCKWCYQGLN